MNKKISLGITISLIAIACAVTFVVTMTVSLNLYNDKIAGVQQRGEMNTRLQEIGSFVRSYSLYGVDENAVKAGVYAGYLDGISDKYARYYTTDEYYYKTMLESGSMTGLGIETENDGGYAGVTSVMAGSPAEEAGIKSGDIITSINGSSILEIGYAAAYSQLRFGDEGTRITFCARRSGEETEYTLTRAAFEIQSVSTTLLDNGIMYIRFTTLNSLSGRQLSEMLSELPDDAVITGYIFDLRDCSSGNYDAISEILSPFVNATSLATAAYVNNSSKVIAETTTDKYTTLPISVIINEKTGGAAELITVTLRDFNGAKLVGMATMGYGTLQETRAFGDGTAIDISVAKIIPEKQDSAYDETGVKPEFAVEYAGLAENDPANYANTYDSQYKKAVEVIISAAAATVE